MSESSYIGINNIAYKVKGMYLGINNVARKVKKAYIGIDDVAKCCFSSEELSYYGTATPLSVARNVLAATTVGNYALFGGGYDSSSTNVVDVYDSGLTRSTATSLSVARYELVATTVGDCVLFCGGFSSDSRTDVVDVYTVS